METTFIEQASKGKRLERLRRIPRRDMDHLEVVEALPIDIVVLPQSLAGIAQMLEVLERWRLD